MGEESRTRLPIRGAGGASGFGREQKKNCGFFFFSENDGDSSSRLGPRLPLALPLSAVVVKPVEVCGTSCLVAFATKKN